MFVCLSLYDTNLVAALAQKVMDGIGWNFILNWILIWTHGDSILMHIAKDVPLFFEMNSLVSLRDGPRRNTKLRWFWWYCFANRAGFINDTIIVRISVVQWTQDVHISCIYCHCACVGLVSRHYCIYTPPKKYSSTWDISCPKTYIKCNFMKWILASHDL